MIPYIQRTLCCLMLWLPLTHAAEQSHTLTPKQLKCLYAQIESLISEPADPVLVLLTLPCESSEVPTLPAGEKTEFPELDPEVVPDGSATLKPEDVLMLSKKQLICFQKQYNKLIQQDKDTIQVSFADSCTDEVADE